MDSLEAEQSLAGLRDTLRSARRWQELLTDADRQAILNDIARVGLAVGSDLQGDLTDLDIGAADNALAPCPIERLAFLRSMLPRVVIALSRIESEPPAALRTEEREIRAERARRISPNALRMAARTLTTPGVPQRIRETIVVPTNDTPAIRAVKTIATIFARDLAAIATIAETRELRTVAMEALRLRAQLQRILKRPPWRDLPVVARVPPLQPTLLRNGPHRLLHDIFRQYRNGFAFDWSPPFFRLSSRDTWLLYEYWSLFATVGALRDLGFRGAEQDGFLRYTENGLTLTLSTDRASRIVLRRGADRVVVTYQRRFERDDGTTDGFHSRGQTMIPDITVERSEQLLILDAKFKTFAIPGAETDDMRQMHAYRDAIRRANTRPVTAAWILFPGHVDGAKRPLIAYPTSAKGRPFGNGEVGAIQARPGDRRYLTRLLAEFLSVPYTETATRE